MEITTLQAQINNGGTLPKIMTQNGEISNVRKQIADNTNQTLNKFDSFSETKNVSDDAGIYSPYMLSKNETNKVSASVTYATSSNISGSNSIIAKNQLKFAKQAGISLNSSMQPIVNSATDAKAAQVYFNLLKTPVKKEVASKYVLNQNDSSKKYYGNCCKTSCEMMAQINSNGTKSANGTTDKIGTSSRVDGGKTYSPTQSGFKDYSGLTKEELSNIIVSEIDQGRVVQLHTSYQNSSGQVNEHWVVVTGYTLDSSGRISTTVQNGREYITGLAGIDPWNDVGGRTQVTDNLGKNATVSSTGQWLNTSTGGYQVRTYKP